MRVDSNKDRKELTLEDFKQAYEFLPEIQKAFRQRPSNKLDRTPNFDVAFFGGEPLLKLKNMLDIAKFIRNEYSNVTCHTPTNGLLLNKKTIKELEDGLVAFSVSYDGPFTNQRHESSKDKKGLYKFPYKKEVQELMKIRGCKAMISPKNVYALSNNFKFFIENGIYYPGLSLVRDNTWTKTSVKEYDRQLYYIRRIIKEFYNKTGKLCIPDIFSLFILDTILSYKQGKRPYSCFVGINGIAVHGDGSLYPCARFGANNRFKLGDYKKKYLNYERINWLMNEINTVRNEVCLKCDLYKICNMGCVYAQLSSNNWRVNNPIPNVCDIFRISFKHALDFYEDYKHIHDLKDFLKHKMES